MCLYPKLIRNRKYTVTKKNNGEVPKMQDPRTGWVPVGCKKCIECRKQKAREWNTRLMEEIRENHEGEFVTLTISNENIKKILTNIEYVDKETGEELIGGYDLDNAIAKYAIRHFLERWRKKYKISARHWLITELGHNGTENIHLHGIIFKAKYKNSQLAGISKQYSYEQKKDLSQIWQYGWVYIGQWVNEQTINYMMKYCLKTDAQHTQYTPVILTTAGIGSKYTERKDAQSNRYNGTDTRETYKNRKGYTQNLPIYYRNKIYTEDEREKLWLQKLDKQERWIMGTKISTKNGLEEYYTTLKYAQAKNKRLGYGDDSKDWTKINYENQQRNILMEKRISEKLSNITETKTTKNGNTRSNKDRAKKTDPRGTVHAQKNTSSDKGPNS